MAFDPVALIESLRVNEMVQQRLNMLKRWLRRNRRRIDRTLAIIALLAGVLGGVTGVAAWRTAVKTRLDSFEPRIVVSRFETIAYEPRDYPDGSKAMLIKTGKLSVKNVGKGEAFNVGCHIVNPFSKKYVYHRFRSDNPVFLACSGEPIDAGFHRARRYTRVLAPKEEQELCVEGLDIDQTIPLFFLAVSCTYTDKEGNDKGGEVQEIELGSYVIESPEYDGPAEKVLEQYRTDQRVRVFEARTLRPAPRRLPTPVPPTGVRP